MAMPSCNDDDSRWWRTSWEARYVSLDHPISLTTSLSIDMKGAPATKERISGGRRRMPMLMSKSKPEAAIFSAFRYVFRNWGEEQLSYWMWKLYLVRGVSIFHMFWLLGPHSQVYIGSEEFQLYPPKQHRRKDLNTRVDSWAKTAQSSTKRYAISTPEEFSILPKKREISPKPRTSKSKSNAIIYCKYIQYMQHMLHLIYAWGVGVKHPGVCGAVAPYEASLCGAPAPS